MSSIKIVQFGINSSLDVSIDTAHKAIRNAKSPWQFYIGSNVQDKDIIQLACELTSNKNSPNSTTTPNSDSFSDILQPILEAPKTTYHVDLNRDPFGPDGPFSSNATVIEYA
jgi:hypothetical protein